MIESRETGIDTYAFGCCFVEDTLAFSFAFKTNVPQNVQTTLASQFAERLPQEEQYRKITYYDANKFESECCKKISGLWIKVQD